MRALWNRWKGKLLSRRYRFTRGGALYFLAVILVAFAAVASANNLVFLILAMMVSTIMVSGLVSQLCLGGLEFDFIVPPHISAGRTFRARLLVRNLKWWMPSFSIQVSAWEDADAALSSSVYFPVIPGGARLEETVEIRFLRRGTHKRNTFAFSTRFPFGFVRKTSRLTMVRDILVYPCLDPKPGFEELLFNLSGDIDTHMQGLGRDFYRIRPYEARESARHVDWKATAHTGELQVREFAREQDRTLEIFFDRWCPHGMEAAWEGSIDCCAFLVWRLAEKSAGIRFRSHDYEVTVPAQGDVYTILKFLALVQPYHAKPPAAPADPSDFQVAITIAPERFGALGWAPDLVLGPDVFGPDAARRGSGSGAGADGHHRQ